MKRLHDSRTKLGRSRCGIRPTFRQCIKQSYTTTTAFQSVQCAGESSLSVFVKLLRLRAGIFSAREAREGLLKRKAMVNYRSSSNSSFLQRYIHLNVPIDNVKVWAERRSPGLVNLFSALAYHFCPALPAAFTQPWDHLLAEPCTSHADIASAFALEQ